MLSKCLRPADRGGRLTITLFQCGFDGAHARHAGGSENRDLLHDTVSSSENACNRGTAAERDRRQFADE